MDEQSIAKLKEVVAGQLEIDVERILKTSNFVEDLGADSLALVELVMAIEEEFSISIPDEDVGGIKTVGDAIKLIDKKQSGA